MRYNLAETDMQRPWVIGHRLSHQNNISNGMDSSASRFHNRLRTTNKYTWLHAFRWLYMSYKRTKLHK